MAYLKPQSPLRHKDGDYFYPLTTIDQVITEDGTRLNVLNYMSVDNDGAIEGEPNPVNADTLGGYSVEEILKYTSALENKLSMELLWENAAPESDFVEQTIPLNLSEYNCVAIYSRGPYIMQFVFKGLASSLVGLVHEISTSNYVACRSRSVSASDTGIKFGSGVEKKLTEKVITTLDSGVKPIYIYGVKGVSV